jgi:hypothetical protein
MEGGGHDAVEYKIAHHGLVGNAVGINGSGLHVKAVYLKAPYGNIRAVPEFLPDPAQVLVKPEGQRLFSLFGGFGSGLPAGMGLRTTAAAFQVPRKHSLVTRFPDGLE